MAKISMYGQGTANSIANIIHQGMQRSALSCELVDSVSRTVGDTNIIVLVFDKYYMRTSNRASLTAVITENNNQVTVDAIGAGGGQGAVFRFSWGAEEDFVKTVASILSQQGFR